jgi:hypothetical protein
MLKCDMKYGFPETYEELLPDNSDSVDSAIVKNAIRCIDEDTCFKWATVYHNISTILNDFFTEYYGEFGNWRHVNNRHLLCELEDGVVRTHGYVFVVNNKSHILELINDVILSVVEGGIFMEIKKRGLDNKGTGSKFVSTYDDTYTTISISHLQTVFYILMLGYVLALVCFVTEVMWHCYRSKGRGPKCMSL